MKSKQLSAILLVLLLCISHIPVLAYDSTELNAVTKSTALYLYNSTPKPQFGSIGGEWCILGLARSETDIPSEYFEGYYQSIEQYVKKCNGILHEKKYTEYSRLSLALTAIGKDPYNVSSYNLLLPLLNSEKTVLQGVNGAAWALLALDSASYSSLNSDGEDVRELYLQHILNAQTDCGGWSLTGDTVDIDITAMTLQALAKYRSRPNVSLAIEKALACISENQNENGGFSESENPESCAQVLVALCSLGISPSDSRFVKNGNTIIDNMLTYYEAGGFKHTPDGTINQMATEQCFYALTALQRFNSGKTALYDMSDTIPTSSDSTNGLIGKISDIQKTSVIYPGKTFSDTAAHENKTSVEALASRGIINGRTEDLFCPDYTITRAEFAAILVRGLGLPSKSISKFADVPAGAWFYSSVGTAYSYGIINGISDTEFNPNATITREEAAVMLARAARLCGNSTSLSDSASRDILAVFPDYITVSDWASASLAFCFDSGILSDEADEIQPHEAATRADIAQMLYNMLSLSRLL